MYTFSKLKTELPLVLKAQPKSSKLTTKKNAS